MRRHDRLDAASNQGRKGHEIIGDQLGQRSSVHGQFGVRIGGDEAVSRKMLADRRHAGGAQSFPQRHGEMGHRVRIAMQCAIADDRARPVIEVEHRCEAEIDATSAQLAAEGEAKALGLARGGVDVAIPGHPQRPHGRYLREALAKSLHPTAFVVDGNQQMGCAQCVYRRGQCASLRGLDEIARKKDYAAGQRMGQPLAVGGGELDVFDADKDRSARERKHHVGRAASRISAFIWRTASRIPTKTARDTMAWPMCSSRTPGSAATGCTLK